MAKLIKSEKILLKNHPEINESAIQAFIFNDPSVLGLGDLIPMQKEKIQPSGGRLDILLSDTDSTSRYEVEIQLGATDPSHIIRTIEYWDTEKKRYPKYDHCAVIVAEEITGRFMNVISLFNGSIPLIALQMSAVKHGDDIELIFTKVLDRVSLGNEEDDTAAETTDRSYWEKNSTPNMLKIVDNIFKELGALVPGYDLKYNKFYIGIAKDGVAKNCFVFRPKKKYTYLCFKGNEDPEMTKNLEDAGFEVTYHASWKEYYVRIDTFNQFEKNKDMFLQIIENARDFYDGKE